MLESIAAGAIVLACLALLLRQFIGESRRARRDAAIERLAHAAQRTARSSRLRVMQWIRWPGAHRAARREAEEAIRRARGDARRWTDDPVRRKSSPKARKLH
jgi:hypothetical protein